MVLWAIVGVVSALFLSVVLLYNRLVRARIKVRQAWAQVDAQLQRRHDLVPNLVATVRAYAGHEHAVLDRVTQARAQALAVRDPVERQAAEDDFGSALTRLLAVTEQYPNLRADQRFAALHDELVATEDRLAFARGFANDRVARYRERIDTLPGRLLAGPMKFPRESMFALEHERVRRAPDVSLEG